jgi:phosphatidylserine/phosphatidylglycerophosphate/cardiolipin synthase-like enzyme
MGIIVKTYHNGDDVFIGWKPDGVIPGCRGFELKRRCNGTDQTVSTWVGFAGEEHKEGERRPSNVWPIQKYQWTDYVVKPGDRLSYRVVPMAGPDKDHLKEDLTRASGWTEELLLSPGVAPGIEVFFNRGIVASQWVSRRLGITEHDLKTAKLKAVIQTPGDSFREYLYGPLGERLFELLDAAAKEGRDIYAALYELEDKQLEDALTKIGMHAHVVLANGSVKKKGDDQNAKARAYIQGKIDLCNRMISPNALGHNKFLVIGDANGKPRWVWTGSQNWTKTGLCTQANNSVLIDSFELAKEYRHQWDLLKDAGDTTPKTLKTSNTKPRNPTIGTQKQRLWFTPTVGLVDLEEAGKLIEGAKEAILFLMFNPGPKDTLLNEIIDTARAGASGHRLYIRGAINQDPSTSSSPVELFDAKNSEKADFAVVLPAAIDEATIWFSKEMKKLAGTQAMVHSKVVVVDPFTAHPILMTGSHNLGPKASKTNDENLVIIKDVPGLAAAYATNIMSIYNQYRWRYRRQIQTQEKRWNGLEDGDSWQNGYLEKGSVALREMDFWAGVSGD